MKIKINPSEIRNLAPMSATVSQLAGVLNDPKYGVNEIVRLIELDGALTANVLRWSNSAFYRSRFEIETVKSAVMRLGINNIVKLSIGRSLAKPMKKKMPGYALVEEELWRHNVAAGLTIETIKQFTSIEVPPIAFTAALLHDIGKLILSRHLDIKIILDLRHQVETMHVPYYQVERELLETDHAEVGAAVAGYWKFPDDIIRVIKLHHTDQVEPFRLLDLVQLANYTAKKIGAATGYSDGIHEPDQAILERLKLNGDKQKHIEEEVKKKLNTALEEFNL